MNNYGKAFYVLLITVIFSGSVFGMYDTRTGRFLQQDPLGITPNPQQPNRFGTTYQYKDGMCLYEYVKSKPSIGLDSFGLFFDIGLPSIDYEEYIKQGNCGLCGPDVTSALSSLRTAMRSYYQSSSWWHRAAMCYGMHGFGSWDTIDLMGVHGGCGDCINTVSVSGKCYSAPEVNYWMWGVMSDLCSSEPISERMDVGLAVIWGTIADLWSDDSGISKGTWAHAGTQGSFSGVFGAKDYCKVGQRGTLSPLRAKILAGLPFVSSMTQYARTATVVIWSSGKVEVRAGEDR